MLDDVVEPVKKVSIVVPVYNTAVYLERCLDSLVGQTYANLEIVCVDDGSTDNSPEILNRYVRKDIRIQIVTQENKGLSGARNAGLDSVSGDYVMFVDSDDYLPLFAVELFMRVALESQAEVVVSNSFFLLSHKKAVQKPDVVRWMLCTDPLKDFLCTPRIFSSTCNKLYRADVLSCKRFIQGIYFEDWPFVMVLFGTIRSYASIPISLYCYDDTNLSIVRSPFSIKKIESYMVGIRFVYDSYRGRIELGLIKKRLAIAVKMCVNKVYRDRKNRVKLSPFLCSEIRRLVLDEILVWKDLPIKTLFRLWMMK